MNFDINAFLTCLGLHELDHQINTYENEDGNLSISVTEDGMLVDRIVFNSSNKPAVYTFHIPIPHTFEEAAKLFKENEMCFHDICTDGEAFQNMKKEYKATRYTESLSYIG